MACRVSISLTAATAAAAYIELLTRRRSASAARLASAGYAGVRGASAPRPYAARPYPTNQLPVVDRATGAVLGAKSPDALWAPAT
jgi:hypothetical protein